MNSALRPGRLTAALSGLLFVLSGLLALIALNIAYQRANQNSVPSEYYFREPDAGNDSFLPPSEPNRPPTLAPPASFEPAPADPTNTEPTNTEPTNTEPTNTQPTNTEPDSSVTKTQASSRLWFNSLG